MNAIIIREPSLSDEHEFLSVMQKSKSLHYPWVQAPQTKQEFEAYIQRSELSTHKCYLVICKDKIVGVYNISEIVRGFFQNAYLGFYATIEGVGQGYMRSGLELVLEKAFTEIALHRLEANIQPKNERSIKLIKSMGFRREGYSPKYLKVNDEWQDHERWAMTTEDWENIK